MITHLVDGFKTALKLFGVLLAGSAVILIGCLIIIGASIGVCGGYSAGCVNTIVEICKEILKENNE